MPENDYRRITTVEQLRAIIPEPMEAVVEKEIHHLDSNCRIFIDHSPFIVMATADAEGNCHATPRGGPPGFVRVLDDRRLLIPDYPGNRRLDGLRAVLSNPRGHLLFFLPRRGETLRVRGDLWITDEPDLLASVADRGKVPALGIGLTVQSAFMHCGKAFKRSGLWEPDAWPDISQVPSSAAIWHDHMTLAEPISVEQIEGILEDLYQEENLY